MLYSITHKTSYQYHEIVNLCHNIAILSPRDTATQTCHSFNISISPVPEIIEEYTDFFGNKIAYFVIEQEHEELSVTATSVVERKGAQEKTILQSAQSWESVKELLQTSTGKYIAEKQYCIPTDITATTPAIEEYATLSFSPGHSLYEAVFDLMQRIYTDFTFTPGFTTISTPLSVVLKERKGVCQDFAHLAIACVHAMGLPARYVSGYLETLPPEGEEKLAGVDASHAWFAVFIPEMGWADFDPTNNQIPTTQYISIGWGRNYSDIIPLRGVIMSSSPHELSVSVDVRRIPE